MRCKCPWCFGVLPGKPGQVAKCLHCGSEIHWGGSKPCKTAEEARAVLQEKALAELRTDLDKAAKKKQPSIESEVEPTLIEPDETELPVGKPVTLTSQISNDNATRNHRLWHYFNRWIWHYLFFGATALIFASLIFAGFNYFRAAFLTKLHDVQLAEEFLAKGFSTSGIEEISPDVAELFVEQEGTLSLSGLTQLTPDVAEALAKYSGTLKLSLSISINEFSDLEELSFDVEELLSGLEFLNVSEFRSLTRLTNKQLAEKLLSQDFDFSNIDELSTEVEEVLVKHQGVLNLPRLTTLTTNQLAKEFLAKGVSTSGIEEISPEVAELFVKHEGDLPFPELTTFNNVPLAKKLLSQGFTFPNIEKISPEVVSVFVSQNFDFSNIKALSSDAAKQFVQHGPTNLSLNGLTSITPEVAVQLVNVPGYLYLSGLTTMTAGVAEQLAKQEGQLLVCLPSLTPDVAEKLKNHKGLLIIGLKTAITKEVAEQLKNHEGGLVLGLPSLTSDAAEELAKTNERLQLRDLTTITPDAVSYTHLTLPTILLV